MSGDTFDREAILNKCRKILAIAEAQGATPAEAANAAGMLKRMLEKYQLSMADVEAGLKKDGMVVVEVAQARRLSALDGRVYETLAQCFDCKLLITTHRELDRYTGHSRITGYTFEVVGCASDAVVAEYFIKHFRSMLGPAFKAYQKERKRGGVAVRNGFWIGAVGMVVKRLMDMHAKARGPVTPEAEKYGALVVVKAGLIDAWMDDEGIKAHKPSRASMEVDPHAMRAGRIAGAELPLQKRIAS